MVGHSDMFLSSWYLRSINRRITDQAILGIKQDPISKVTKATSFPP
jgi:hypothetical protein